MQRRNIGHSAQRDQIEQSEQVWFLPVRKEAALAQISDNRDRQQEGDANRGQMAMSGGLLDFVEPVRIDQRHGLGQLGRAFVMIDHDNIDPGSARHIERFERHRPAIDRDDQAGALFGQPDQRFTRGAIAFEQAVGDVIVCLVPQFAQQPDQQRRAGRSINVIVAVDGDGFVGQYRLDHTLSRYIHVLEQRRIGQKSPQRRIAVPLKIVRRHAAGQKQLSDQIVIERSPAQIHVPTAPMPSLAQKRTIKAKDG